MAYPKFSKVGNKVVFENLEDKVCCPDSVLNYEQRHPRVFIQIEDGQGVCPYCGTLFVHSSKDKES